jgi:hypothetical protein
VKNFFADTAPPAPSDGLLARLQGLPAGGPEGTRDGKRSDSDQFDGPGGGPGSGISRATASTSGAGAGESVWAFDYLRGGRGSSALFQNRGFRIHEMDRLSSRGRRFAFAAAGAVSVAALALGGGLGSASTSSGAPAVAKGDSSGASASSARTASSAAGSERDRRRRDAGPVRSERTGGALSLSTTSSGASGESVNAGRDVSFHRGAPWAAPSAPPAEQPETGYSLLRDAFFASPLTRSALPSVTYNSYSYGTEAHAGTFMDADPGRTPVESAPAPSPLTTAAPPRG